MRSVILAAGIIFIFFSLTTVVRSQEGLRPSPITIEADRMESSQEDSAVFFSGNVQANQDNLIIQADEMTVMYTGAETRTDSPSGPEGSLSQNIEQIKASGNVKIVQEDWVAAGDTMNFNADDRIITLAGNARAWQNKNMVSGEKIILYLDEGRSVVERSSAAGERVKALIYPSPQEKKDSDNPRNQ